jgi:ferredoxin
MQTILLDLCRRCYERIRDEIAEPEYLTEPDECTTCGSCLRPLGAEWWAEPCRAYLTTNEQGKRVTGGIRYHLDLGLVELAKGWEEIEARWV